jgi:hypothetical protein
MDIAAMVRDVLRWAESLPPGTVQIREEPHEYEHFVILTPRVRGGASLTVSFGRDGTYEVFAGSTFRSGELRYDIDQLLETCEAVSKGRLKEETWQLFGHVVRSRAHLERPSGDWYDRGIGPPLGSRSIRQYGPWY